MDESPEDRQARLERHEEIMSKREERLQKQNARLHDRPPPANSGGGGFGSAVGGIGSFFGEHKVILIGAAVVVIGGMIVYNFVQQNNSTATAGAANAAPDYAASGIMTSNIAAALDSMNQEIEALQNTTSPAANPSSSFQWPSALTGMKVWEGTTTHDFFYGANGPQPGRAGQSALSGLFPAGTIFSATNGGAAGSQLMYEIPGGTWQTAPVALVNPTPTGLRTISH